MSQTTDRPLRVIQWTTGNIGRRSLHAIIGRPDMELVGVYAHGDDKVGMDAAELAGLSAACAVTDSALPEREPHPAMFVPGAGADLLDAGPPLAEEDRALAVALHARTASEAVAARVRPQIARKSFQHDEYLYVVIPVML